LPKGTHYSKRYKDSSCSGRKKEKNMIPSCVFLCKTMISRVVCTKLIKSCYWWAISPFITMISTQPNLFLYIYLQFYMSSAISFNLRWFKIFHLVIAKLLSPWNRMVTLCLGKLSKKCSWIITHLLFSDNNFLWTVANLTLYMYIALYLFNLR